MFIYATSVCYASAIAQAIINGEECVVENYKEFLKAGNSCIPEEALKIVGIDITDSAACEDGLQYFYGIPDEYEALTGK